MEDSMIRVALLRIISRVRWPVAVMAAASASILSSYGLTTPIRQRFEALFGANQGSVRIFLVLGRSHHLGR
jgi:hypothetical protein